MVRGRVPVITMCALYIWLVIAVVVMLLLVVTKKKFRKLWYIFVSGH